MVACLPARRVPTNAAQKFLAAPAAGYTVIASKVLGADRLEVVARHTHNGRLEVAKRFAAFLASTCASKLGAVVVAEIQDASGFPVYTTAVQS